MFCSIAVIPTSFTRTEFFTTHKGLYNFVGTPPPPPRQPQPMGP